MATPLLVVDAANVVGSTPDGWWRDRAGATRRLRDRLESLARTGLPQAAAELAGPIEVVLVVEGAAQGIGSSQHVRVLDAAGSGDDAIVALVAANAGSDDGHGSDRGERVCAVVSADRALRRRVIELGAIVLGPSTLTSLNPPDRDESVR